MRVVIKIGGHLISDKNNILNASYIHELLRVFNKIKEEHETIVITGGGFISRVYIDVLRENLKNECYGDILGIKASRLNALLLALLMNHASIKKIPETVEELLALLSFHKVIFMGGLQPGQSTTTTAAIVAEAVNADLLIIATNVDGIYTEDPNLNSQAKKLDKVSIGELKQIFRDRPVKAGTYKLIDYLTINILERSKMPTIILNGNPPTNILKAIKGEKIGTKITY
ncbi:MAG: UMP kinase [Thermoprotei archaeon]|nr:UMP kinase [Thermoproteales archaeon]RLE85577.1 MAG: UMP kinase [Thermoprotei archaeon]